MTPRSKADAVTNVEVVVYALAELQGADRPVHLERIAHKAHELVPGSFRWDLEEFSNLVDKDKVRVSLSDAEKVEKGAMVEGVGATKKGQSKRSDLWRLTSSGAVWVLENQQRIHTALAGPTPRFKKGKAGALRSRVKSNPLYEEFDRSGTVSPNFYAFTDLLECSPDAADSVITQRLDELRAQIQMLEDETLLGFLDVSAKAHADEIQRS